jgi:hypothetical protein
MLFRENTPLEEANIKKEKNSGPLIFVRENSSTQLLVAVENQHLDHFWNIIPLEGKLN